MDERLCYAAYIKDEYVRLKSSSGGLFSLFGEMILKSNGVVYGVSMTEDCYGAEFTRIENDLKSLRGSKYLQAKLGDTYKSVKSDLDSGKNVLFTGTACQINGLCLFLKKKYNNLICIDVICHGVPSPKLWKEYVLYQEKKYGKLNSMNFRCKDKGWSDYRLKENDSLISKDDDPYMRMFLRDYCLRPSCYNCHSKKCKYSDITLGDFWGIQNVAPEMNDEKGTSLVVIRSEKGKEIFELVESKITYKEVFYEESVQYNPAECKSVKKPELRNSFFKDLNSLTFDEMIAKYASDIKVSFYKKIIRKGKRIINKMCN